MAQTTAKKKLSKKAIRILRKVQAHILEEPHRLTMQAWGMVHSEAGGTTGYEIKDDKVPACRTTGCVAGWTIFLNNLKLWKDFLKNAKDAGENINLKNETEPMDVAAEILGLSEEEALRLFVFSSRSVGTNEGWPEKFSGRYQRAKTAKTRAKVTAERIEHFIHTNGAE